MKIVIVSQAYYPRPGGVSEHVHHSAVELRRRGHDVTIVTSNCENRPDKEPGVVRIGRNVLVPINGAWTNMTVGTNLMRDLRVAFDSLEPDVIHTHQPLAPMLPLMTLFAAPPSARVVGTFHSAARGRFGYLFWRHLGLERRANRLDLRIAVSNAAVDLAAKYFPSHYEIIPNGVDCNRFTPDNEPIDSLRDDAFNILFVGRLDRRKGLKYLFQAVKQLRGMTPRRLRLIVVGDDGPRRLLLPRLPADIEVVFAGLVSKTELPRYFVTGDVFVSPATEGESFGIVLLEAMASGIPVIGSAIPGYLTVLRDRDNAFVVPPKQPRAIANAIHDMIEHPGMTHALRSRALDFAQDFSWHRVVDRLESAYGAEPPPAYQTLDEIIERSLRVKA